MITRKHLLQVASIVLGGALLLGYQNCAPSAGTGDTSVDASSSENDPIGGNTNNPNGNTPNPATPALPKISISALPAQASNLGTQIKIPVSVMGDLKYSGTVSLQVLKNELKLLDTASSITFSFSPATLSLSAGVPSTSMLTIDIPTKSPSFANSVFHILATDSVNSAISFKSTVPLSIRAIFDIYIANLPTNIRSPEVWSIPIGQVQPFISHTGGLMVRVNNMDSAVHLVHSSGGGIPHQRTNAPSIPGATVAGLPGSLDGGVTVGSSYINVVAAAARATTANLYDHLHEGAAQSRPLQFNVPVVAAPKPPINNPNATFTYVNNNILKVSCVACHTGATASAGVDLSTYAGVSAFITKGNSSVSSLFSAIDGAMPSMPLGGAPLSPAFVQTIADWIDLGGLNN